MFDARLTDLFKAFVVHRTAAHSIKILRNHRVVIARIGKPVQIHRAEIAGIGSDGETDLRSAVSAELRQSGQVSDNHIRSRNHTRFRAACRQDIRCDFAVNDLCNFYRAHSCGNRDLSDDQSGIRRSPKFDGKFL